MAVEQLADRCTVTVLWKPYFLDENLSEEGLILRDFMLKLKGEEAAQKTMRRQGLLYVEAEKMNMFLDINRPVNNSVKSHCLLDLAANISLQKQNELVELFFQGHLSSGERINDVDFLLRCVREIGIDVDQALAYMNDTENQQRMYEEFHAARAQIGLTRLPFIVMSLDENPDQRLAFAGDQSVETFVAILERLLAFPTAEQGVL